MGSPVSDQLAYDAEKPQHHVRITRPFLLGMYPVTQCEYQRVMGENPSRFRDDDRLPVEWVSWFDAVNFCNRLSELEGIEPYYDIDGEQVRVSGGSGYRLPTEAQWEYACRAGTTTRWYYGDDPEQLTEYAWFDQNSGGRTHSVGEKLPNAWGLYDMHGNVWEWCWDWYGKYGRVVAEDPTGPSGGSYRVYRGGGWAFDAGYCRAAYRGWDTPSLRDGFLGFRLARSVSLSPAR